MKLKKLGLVGAMAFMLVCNTHAEGPGLADKSMLVGTWVLEGTSIREDGKKAAENSKWEFTADGKMNTTSYYKFGNKLGGEGSEGHTSDTWEVKDGKLVRAQGGTYDVVQMQGSEMILKNAGLFYFFKKE
jgi:hypothetical protein